MKRFVFLLLLLAAAAGLFGCAQVKDEDVATPWSRPEPWEHNIDIGGPFMGPR